MDRLTKDSPKQELVQALVKVITAIESLNLISELGLATHNTLEAIKDLRVYERQLLEYIGN